VNFVVKLNKAIILIVYDVMRQHQQTGRQLKKKIQTLLLQNDFESGLADIAGLPARRAINPLFSFLCSMDEVLKWRAVTAMGAVVDRLAMTDIESARVIMRRLMWHLNDESGGIGWGCPEAMGEIMARNAKLADEFWCILISYVQPDGNFLEHETLQRGLLWGVGRLAHARPQLLKDCTAYLQPFLQAGDPNLRGLAAWAAGALPNKGTEAQLKKLGADTAMLSIYIDRQLVACSVAELAAAAIKKTHTS
jgi:hypothetical protein